MCLFALTVSAQKTNRTSAYSYMNKGELKKAWEYINKAIEHPQTKEDAKTWKYRGDIIEKTLVSQDVEIQTLAGENPLDEMANSWKKAISYDAKGTIKKELDKTIPFKEAQMMNIGVKMFQEEKYKEAFGLFVMADMYAGIIDKLDTNAVFNAALAAQNADLLDEAAEMYKRLIEVNYGGADMFVYLNNIYKIQNKEEESLALIKEGREKYPDNESILLDELNYFLKIKDFDKARANIELAIEKDPTNKLLHFNKGVILSDIDMEASAQAYEKAIEIDPAYGDAYFNLGSMFYNEGANLNNEANKLDFRKEGSKIEKLQAEAKTMFEKAKPHLEKSLELDPENRDIMNSLKELYVFLKDNEKYAEMKAKLAQ